MTDPMRKWAQGDEWEPSASWLNMVTEAALQAQQGIVRPTASDGQLFQAFTPIRLYNATGEPIPQLGVVGYKTPMVLPADNENRFINDTTLIATKPIAPLDRFAISLNRVETGGVFWGICGGVVPCKVSGTGDKVRSITDDMTKLLAGTEGAELVWSESGSSTRFGLVKLFGGGSSTATASAKIYNLQIRGNANGGTFDYVVEQWDPVDDELDTLGTGSFNWDFTKDEVLTELSAADPTVQAMGGDLPYNAIRILFPDPTIQLRVTTNSLTKETDGVPPIPECSACFQPLDEFSS